MDTKEKVKADIIECFRRNNADVSHALNDRAFMQNYTMKYNPKEKSVLQDAFDELASEGLIEEKNNRIVLTQKGMERVYPEPLDSVKEKVKADIIECFRRNNPDVGHALNDRAFMQNYTMKYNPKEKSVLQDAFDELASEGLIEENNNSIVLTQKGVENIY